MNTLIREGFNSYPTEIDEPASRFLVAVKMEAPVCSDAVSFYLDNRPKSYLEAGSFELEFIRQALNEICRYKDCLGKKMAEIDFSIHFLRDEEGVDNQEKIEYLKRKKKEIEKNRQEAEKALAIYRHGETEVRKRAKYFFKS